MSELDNLNKEIEEGIVRAERMLRRQRLLWLGGATIIFLAVSWISYMLGATRPVSETKILVVTATNVASTSTVEIINTELPSMLQEILSITPTQTITPTLFHTLSPTETPTPTFTLTITPTIPLSIVCSWRERYQYGGSSFGNIISVECKCNHDICKCLMVDYSFRNPRILRQFQEDRSWVDSQVDQRESGQCK